MVSAPYGVTSNTIECPKVGIGTLTSYAGIVTIGQGCINSIAEEAGITRIHYVDYQTMNIAGFYARVNIMVYGE